MGNAFAVPHDDDYTAAAVIMAAEMDISSAATAMAANAVSVIEGTNKEDKEKPEQRIIEWDLFEPNKACSDVHVAQMLALENVNATEEAIESRKKMIDREKFDLGAWGRQRVKLIITENARALNMKQWQGTRRVQCYDDVVKVWQKSGHKAVQGEQIWHCSVGWFEKNPEWSKKLEETYMKSMNWKYAKTGNKKLRNKCVEKVLHHAKVKVVRQLNKCSDRRDSHGMKFGVRREKVTDKEKKGRRPRGMFNAWFIKPGKASKVSMGYC